MAAQQWVCVVFLVSLSFEVCFSHRVIINKQVEKPEEVKILEGLEENNNSSNIDVNVEKYPAFAFKHPTASASASHPSSESGNNTIVSTPRSGPISDSEKWGSRTECCSNNNCESCNNEDCGSCTKCQSSCNDYQSCDNCQGCKTCESSCQTCSQSCGGCQISGQTCGGCQTCGQSCNNPSINIPGYNVPIRGLRCTPIDCCPGCDCDTIQMHFNHDSHIKKANNQDDVENKVELTGDKVKQDSLPLNDFEPSNSNVEEIYATNVNEELNINWEDKNVAAMPPMID